jgi:hypothetical protein
MSLGSLRLKDKSPKIKLTNYRNGHGRWTCNDTHKNRRKLYDPI